MSALHRMTCPHCGKDVMLLRETADTRWICCHCDDIIDLDALEGAALGEALEIDKSSLPIAHAAPPVSPPANLGEAPERAAFVAVPVHGAISTDNSAPVDRAMRYEARMKVRRRLQLVHLLTGITIAMAIMIVLYPIRLPEDSVLPLLHPYFRGRPLEFPYLFGSPRWLLCVLLLFMAYGIHSGKPWALALSIFATLVGCIAFNFHPAAVLTAVTLTILVGLLHRRIQVVEG